ncbi:MAG TPA: ABC transporter permease [Acholeplasmataceae bacterium]|nr:ABC transporter permease [Acholeplasmataceae bacterium]
MKQNILFGNSRRAQSNRSFWLFLLPSLSAFIIFVIVPFFTGIYYSFTNWSGLNTGNESFVGFDNYRQILSDPQFGFSFLQTATYSLLAVVIINIVAFGLALIVTQNTLMKNVYRAGFFLPNLIGGLVLGYIWQFLYNRALIVWFEPSLIAVGETSILGLSIVVTWQYAGYIMMIYIAALQNVPQDLIEAATIDGANAWQRLKAITFPLVAQAFTIALFLTLVTSFKQYDTVVSLTQSGPAMQMPVWFANLYGINPITVQSTEVITYNIYETAFVRFQLGVGQAKAILFFILIGVIGGLQVYFTQKREVEM